MKYLILSLLLFSCASANKYPVDYVAYEHYKCIRNSNEFFGYNKASEYCGCLYKEIQENYSYKQIFDTGRTIASTFKNGIQKKCVNDDKLYAKLLELNKE